MDETKRFLRYVIPGLIMVSEMFIFLYLSLVQNGYPIENIRTSVVNYGIPVIFSGILILTGIGAVMSNFYHVSFNLSGVGLNYKELVRIVSSSGRVSFRDYSTRRIISVNEITNYGQWRIIDALWHGNKISSGVLGGNVKRTEDLCNLAHSLGTSFVSSILAYVSWNYFYVYITGKNAQIGFQIAFLVLLILHYIATRIVIESAQSVISVILINELENNPNIPNVLYLTKLEYSKHNFVYKFISLITAIALIIGIGMLLAYLFY